MSEHDKGVKWGRLRENAGDAKRNAALEAEVTRLKNEVATANTEAATWRMRESQAKSHYAVACAKLAERDAEVARLREMTFDELRATISAEMPPGWCWRLEERRRIYLDVNRVEADGRTASSIQLASNHLSADTPEALLAAWRELKGRLG